MADGTTLNTMTGGDKIRDIDRGATGKTQVMQPDIGGAAGEVLLTAGQQAKADSLPVTLASNDDSFALFGPVTETAPASDTASSGLNGRLQRIAQRLTSLIALVPASLGQKAMAASLAVVLASDQSTIPVQAGKGQQTVTDCTITSGGSLSGAIDLGVYRLVGIALPATFEPTTLSFQASYDGSTYNNVYDTTGTEKTMAASTSRRIILSPADFFGIRYIKVRGGTAASPTTVAADRILKLVAEA